MHRVVSMAARAAISVSCFMAVSAEAQVSPAGLWRTIDDHSGKDKSLVRIVDAAGVLSGRIEKLLDPSTHPDAVCDACSDERKNKPLKGLLVIRNVHRSAEQPEQWDGGDILDPKTGQIYRVRLKPQEGGRKLEVRGYFGAPSFGRSQIWQRVE